MEVFPLTNPTFWYGRRVWIAVGRERSASWAAGFASHRFGWLTARFPTYANSKRRFGNSSCWIPKVHWYIVGRTLSGLWYFTVTVLKSIRSSGSGAGHSVDVVNRGFGKSLESRFSYTKGGLKWKRATSHWRKFPWAIPPPARITVLPNGL